ncbi:hypothetical protein [Mucilaginibacter ginsenosidivorans]|uniref:Uncharacterized protein n=1 Tax=Mucilaginibacter ginsenosidivorans TaxID=398053 RepID=A0A5B8UUC2_9SPHI|nr:hypothetical protein [Mucilaginibacter ginsenosidivorans]QEC62533.1 hypothetical protein FRZ54_08000 [Mucilaginibacter ginsenosidivorans]
MGALRAAGLAFRVELQQRLLNGAAGDGLRLFLRQQLRAVTELGFRMEAVVPAGVSELEGCRVLEAELGAVSDLLLDGGALDAGGELPAYPAYGRQLMGGLGAPVEDLLSLLDTGGVDAALCGCVRGYLSYMRGAGVLHRPAYRDLAYFRGLVRLLEPLGRHPAGDREGFLREELLRHNFNHLGFLLYLQARERCAVAAGEAADGVLPEAGGAVLFREGPPYDPGLPGIRELFYRWLREWRAGTVPAAAEPVAAVTKLKLDLSVAHLACLLRAMHEAGAIGMPLADLFRAVPGCFSSRRRGDISAGSFNKEFYSASQFTAARVRDLLLRMAGLISARYFPAMAAIMLTILWR